MNLWAVSSLPVYSERGARRRSEKRSKSSSVSVVTASHRVAPTSYTTTTPTSTTSPVPAFAPSNNGHFLHHDPSDHYHNELLEPAINGPPSPESIRQLSKQMKKASQRDKHLSHHTTSSGSSSLRSLTSTDSPSTDGAFSLSRKSSGRSTNSHTMPNRDRPESVQIFGKTLFNRRGRLKRESSSQNLYSAETGSDANLPLHPTSQPAPTSAPSRDSSIPAFFSRRRTIKAENAEDSVGQRKIQISGPYNFQHVAHTKKGSNVDDLHFSDFSSDSLPLADVDLPPSHRPPSMSAKQTTPPRRLIKHAKSQDSMSIAPPRPPRSPIEESIPVPPVPGIPPRVSSRISTPADGLDPSTLGRPQTSTGFRQAQPVGLDTESPTPPVTSHGHTRMVSVPDNDLNWPLPAPANPAFDAAPLPNVPEEEEAASIMKLSRASVISNSSLRASQSVPMLRAFSPRQDYDHHSREPSDTLGPCTLVDAQRALVSALDEIIGGDSLLSRESWEDDIDYCYEHNAEADCDYEWDRPSLDISRDCGSTTPVEHHYHRKKLSCNPSMLTPAQLDIPSLSPVSLNSATTPHEAITPTGMTAALPPTFTHSHSHKTSNFSLPRIEAPARSASSDLLKTPELHARKPSDASSFKESHGFTLSPSLLIPTDFQRQMRLDSLDEGSGAGAEGDFNDCRSGEYPFAAHAFCEPGISSLKYNPHRASASTTATLESINSGRHVSTASISTDFTRLTLSTNSLVDMENCNYESPVCEFPNGNNHVRSESVSAKGGAVSGAMPPVPEFEEISDESLRRGESFPNLVGLAQDHAEAPVAGSKRKDSMLGGLQRPGRGRARTTSLSTPPPPNQFSLFPNVRLTGPQI